MGWNRNVKGVQGIAHMQISNGATDNEQNILIIKALFSRKLALNYRCVHVWLFAPNPLGQIARRQGPRMLIKGLSELPNPFKKIRLCKTVNKANMRLLSGSPKYFCIYMYIYILEIRRSSAEMEGRLY